jgi:hypothetical protein
MEGPIPQVTEATDVRAFSMTVVEVRTSVFISPSFLSADTIWLPDFR